MPRNQTTFQPGHKGFGGRPKGRKSGSNKARRKVQTVLVELARQIDKAFSEILSQAATLNLIQLTKLSAALRQRLKAYVGRSEHCRPIVKTGGFELHFPRGINFPEGVIVGRQDPVSSPTPNKANVIGLCPDVGARRAAKRIRGIDRDIEKVNRELSQPSRTIVSDGQAKWTRAISTFAGLVRAEKELLDSSKDPRPLIKRSPAHIIRFLHIPCDPLKPDYTKPSRILGGRKPTDFWTSDEIEEARLKRERRPTQSHGSAATTSHDAKQTPPIDNSGMTIEFDGVPFDIIRDESGILNDSAVNTAFVQGRQQQLPSPPAPSPGAKRRQP